MGLRYEADFIQEIIMSDVNVGHSPIWLQFQRERELAVNRARIETQRNSIRTQGVVKFGPLPDAIRERLEPIDSFEELEAMSLRLLSVNSWEELFDNPKKKVAKRKKT
jgi:hypothetical protein